MPGRQAVRGSPPPSAFLERWENGPQATGFLLPYIPGSKVFQRYRFNKQPILEDLGYVNPDHAAMIAQLPTKTTHVTLLPEGVKTRVGTMSANDGFEQLVDLGLRGQQFVAGLFINFDFFL